MALATRFKVIQTLDDDFIDITKNLPSLQFESSLSEDEKRLIVLRPINHAQTVTHCALATVMVDIFNRARKGLFSLLNQDTEEADKTEICGEDTDPLIVGIIGCGRLGRQIANCLLTYGQLPPARLKISTRRPETLDLQDKGVECYFNNRRLVSSVHVVILCVLPSQMFSVAEEIKDCISSSQIVISHFSSFPARRLSQILCSSNIISLMLRWSGENPEMMKYDHSRDVIAALENRETVLHTCPIGAQKADGIVSTDHRLPEMLILAVVNMCSEHALSQEHILTIVHHAVFGESCKKPITCDRLVPRDFGIAEILEDNNRCFPFYNLVDVFENGSDLSKVLLGNESLQKAFISRYCRVFEDYILKRKYGHL
ncbi:hypothetical protein BsWGS_15055 [Bradybaena similaris]